MKQYIFYNKKTGEIIHTHTVYKFGSDKPRQVKRKDLKLMVRRFIDMKNTRYVFTNIPKLSSSTVMLKVNPKTKKLIKSKLPRDFWKKKLEQKQKFNPKEVGK